MRINLSFPRSAWERKSSTLCVLFLPFLAAIAQADEQPDRLARTPRQVAEQLAKV